MRLLCKCMIILFFFCSGEASGQTLVLNTNHISPRSTPQGAGFEDRIIDEAFRRIGLEVKIIDVPSERALINVNEGMDDGNFARIAGLELRYPSLVMVPEKICEFEFAAFTMDPAVKIDGWESLKPYDVGIEIGWKILEANIVGARSLTKVKDHKALFDLLVNGRADLVIFDLMEGEALIKELGFSGVRTIQPLLAKQDMFLYLNLRHAALVPKLAAALREMKNDGTFQRIMSSVPNQSEKE